jgi:hypothetical protein
MSEGGRWCRRSIDVQPGDIGTGEIGQVCQGKEGDAALMRSEGVKGNGFVNGSAGGVACGVYEGVESLEFVIVSLI